MPTLEERLLNALYRPNDSNHPSNAEAKEGENKAASSTTKQPDFKSCDPRSNGVLFAGVEDKVSKTSELKNMLHLIELNKADQVIYQISNHLDDSQLLVQLFGALQGRGKLLLRYLKQLMVSQSDVSLGENGTASGADEGQLNFSKAIVLIGVDALVQATSQLHWLKRWIHLNKFGLTENVGDRLCRHASNLLESIHRRSLYDLACHVFQSVAEFDRGRVNHHNLSRTRSGGTSTIERVLASVARCQHKAIECAIRLHNTSHAIRMVRQWGVADANPDGMEFLDGRVVLLDLLHQLVSERKEPTITASITSGLLNEGLVTWSQLISEIKKSLRDGTAIREEIQYRPNDGVTTFLATLLHEQMADIPLGSHAEKLEEIVTQMGEQSKQFWTKLLQPMPIVVQTSTAASPLKLQRTDALTHLIQLAVATLPQLQSALEANE